ncbi:MAG: CPBP family intramembrane metalloprotease [Lachnospiraceae bacterium]|nr:CPBP family intramembrane metalloprotease [Lachnospiraceae bacterium]
MNPKNTRREKYIWSAVNIASLVLLGLMLQTGGAYLVNASVGYLQGLAGEGAQSALTDAAVSYGSFMESIRSLGSRQIIHVMFVAPIVEEIVFRLIFLRAGKMVMPFWAANLIQAALFGLYHTEAVQRVYGFVMGLFIGCVFYYCPLIYRRSHAAKDSGKNEVGGGSEKAVSRGLSDMPDSLIGTGISVLLHMVINSSGLFLIPHFDADIPYGAQFAIGTVLMLICAASVFILYRRSSQK